MLIYNQDRNVIFEASIIGIRCITEKIGGKTQIMATTIDGEKSVVGIYPTRELAQMELNNIAESFNTGKTVYYMTKEEEKL